MSAVWSIASTCLVNCSYNQSETSELCVALAFLAYCKLLQFALAAIAAQHLGYFGHLAFKRQALRDFMVKV